MLVRDTDFLIAPVNATRIEAVCGPFVLGMDRGTVQQRERAALYAGLAAVDQDALLLAAGHDADDLLAGVHGIDAVAGYARIVAGRTAQRLFGISGMDAPLFRDVVRAVFGHTFLNLGGDAAIEARALRAAALMRGWFEAEIARRRQSGVPGEDMMGQLLRQGTLDDDGVRRTLSGMLVGSIDTTATCVAKILSVMAQDSELTERATAAEPAPLYGYCLEALRRWPHNPILMRVAARDTMLGGRRVEAGDKVIVWTQAAMQDRKAFAQPRRMLPRAERDYLHFGSELHVCAGHDVNRWQIPLLVGRVLRRGYAIDGAMGWAGPFPDHLPIRLD